MSNGYCYLHNPDISEEEKQLTRVKGGENNIVMVGEVIPPRSIRTSADIVELMEDIINRVGRGELDIRVANTMGYLAGVSQKSIRDTEIEDRLKRIEEALI